MRCRFAQIAVFATACLLIGGPQLGARSTDSTPSCPASAPSDEKLPSGPAISIVEVTISGSSQMPISDQEQIADSVKQRTSGTSLDAVMEEGLERVRAGWQDRGYFKVEVTGEARTLTTSPVSQRVALRVHVDEGSRYTLSGITFQNNKAISNLAALRGLFPIKDGDVFSRDKIATGLENLRKAYGEIGYINFTSIPDTKLDDRNKLISLNVDFDEGKQFRIEAVNVLGLEESARDEFLKTLPIKRGQIYSDKLWEDSLLKYVSICDCPNREQLRQNNNFGAVIITLDFRPCSQD
jgi:outer membrane protein insertion porin family